MADLADLGRKLLCAVTGDADICGMDSTKQQDAVRKEAEAILTDKGRFRRALEKPENDLTAAERIGVSMVCDSIRRTESEKSLFEDFQGCRAFLRSALGRRGTQLTHPENQTPKQKQEQIPGRSPQLVVAALRNIEN
jgi:hypothetical protein